MAMNSSRFNPAGLIVFQKYLRNLITLILGLIVAIFLVDKSLAGIICYWTVVGLLVSTVLRLVVLAVQFGQARLRRGQVLSILLVLVLALVVIIDLVK